MLMGVADMAIGVADMVIGVADMVMGVTCTLVLIVHNIHNIYIYSFWTLLLLPADYNVLMLLTDDEYTCPF